MSKKVLFNLAPSVYLYRKCCEVVNLCTLEMVEMATPKTEPQIPGTPPPPLLFLRKEPELPVAELKIEIPGAKQIKQEEPTPPPYDMSPLSPNSHREIHGQRRQEVEIRKDALKIAITEFQGTAATPGSACSGCCHDHSIVS